MRCSTFSKSLKEYIAEELSEDAAEMMTNHINKCQSCKTLYNNELESYSFLQRMSSTRDTSFISSRGDIMRKIDKTKYKRTFSNKLFFFVKRKSLSYAVGSVVAASLIFIILFAQSHFNDLKLANILPNKHSSSNVVPTAEPNKATKELTNNQGNKNTSNNFYKYENNKLGFSFTLPASWNGKYIIKEAPEGIYVLFKPVSTDTEDLGLLFSVVKSNPENDAPLDNIGEPRYFEAKGIKYEVGGPRDIGFPETHKEFKNYIELKNEAKDVIKTIKVIGNNVNQQSDQGQEKFFGKWIIKKELAFGPVGTFSNDDIKGMIGKILIFSKENASCFGDQVSNLINIAANPTYKKSVVSKKDFESNYRVTFDKLGIKYESITEVNVNDSKGNECVFFIKDDSLIIYGGGVFFELDRMN